MAQGRHRRRRMSLLSHRSRERCLVGGLLGAMVVGQLFIFALTVQSLRTSQPLRSDRSSSSTPTPTPDSRRGQASTPAPLGAPKSAPGTSGR